MSTTSESLSQRLDDLEVKSGFAEDLLDELNLTVFRQQQQIDRLTRELLALREQFARSAPAPGAAGADDPRAEIPPHY